MENKTPAVTAADARRAYQKQWYQRNKARVRERQKQFWQRKADEMNAALDAERKGGDMT